MIKNRFYKDFTPIQLSVGDVLMKSEMVGLDYKHPIRTLYLEAWQSFERGEWSYDGATFVKERFSNSLFELASFIHDWRNSMGYVGSWVDKEFIDIMICLNYPFNKILIRYLLMRLTFINVLLHKIKKNYNTDKPSLIYQLK